MFESIKKKFAEASEKLSNKVSKEAEEENNIKIEDEIKEQEKFKKEGEAKEEKSEDEINDSQEQINTSINDESNNYIGDENLSKDKELILDNEVSKDNKKEGTFSKLGNKLGLGKSEVSKDQSDKIKSDDDISQDSDEKTSEDENINEEKKSGIFSFIREKTISEKDVEDILWELELTLLESDVAIDVANVVVESVKEDLIGQKIKRSNDIEEYTYKALKNAVSKIIDIDGKSMTNMIEEKKKKGESLVVMFVGINGTGKTTTIGKLANYYLKKGYTPVVAASDTFRAGAIEQITHHTDNLGVKIVKHEKESDPAAVAFDAVEHAKAKGKELVLIDTAGRMQTNTNLMDEMKKIKRVAKPDLVIFVGDSLTGNDAVEQAIKFNDAIDVDGVILTKADADSKGGASLSIGYVIGKPILFLGMGQGYEDIKEYDSDWMLEQIFS
ncbi:Signal recognition particle 54 kDa protein [Candidatus Methanobinarius endosymbioticus]|uniref:Signal recognition particle receptor FtsY n=1 Tax=Candidatus Methanobinarius endosymbioticus TaxID=2006182 RepID=A0A366MCP8_9EURY|nr:Signal recognition particle 54 kDa protein [Candidatus Methanobinarius endosymbioticus]